MKCLDCDTSLDGARFCPRCGQRVAVGRLRWQDIYRDIHHQLLEGNLPWPRTLWRVTRDPGGVARDYVDGKRARHVHPLKFAFYLALIATIVLLDSNSPWAASLRELPWWRSFLLTNPPAFMLLVSPVAVATLRLCFWRPYNMIEIWVLVLYLLGQLSLLLAVSEGIDSAARLVLDDESVTYIMAPLVLIVIIVYYIWGVHGFFRGRVHWSLIGAAWSLTGAVLSIAATVIVAVALFAWLLDPAILLS